MVTIRGPLSLRNYLKSRESPYAYAHAVTVLSTLPEKLCIFPLLSCHADAAFIELHVYQAAFIEQPRLCARQMAQVVVKPHDEHPILPDMMRTFGSTIKKKTGFGWGGSVIR